MSDGTQIAVLQVEMQHLARQLEATQADVKLLTTTLHQVQGGWRVLGLLASIGGALAGLFGSWLVNRIGN